jgi:hypothetical protein
MIAITTISSISEKPCPLRRAVRRYGEGRNDGRRMQQELDALETLGVTLPSPAYILGAIVFGVLGLAAYVHGRRAGRPRTRWLGLALMLYPYLIWNTVLLYVVGLGLSLAVWLDRR